MIERKNLNDKIVGEFTYSKEIYMNDTIFYLFDNDKSRITSN